VVTVASPAVAWVVAVKLVDEAGGVLVRHSPAIATGPAADAVVTVTVARAE